MLTKYLNLLKNEYSEQRAFDHVTNISLHHRIQASPGHRAAAKYCEGIFRQSGLKTEILSYAGDGKTEYFKYLMPQEWVASKGILEIVQPTPEVIANFENVPISLIQRSIATDPLGTEAELIILDKGDEESNYLDLDFTNKFVLTSGNYDYIREWAIKRGALAIITDRIVELPPIRHRYDMGEALTYTSFWWYGDEQKCFGFVLSPKTGDKLRRLAQDGVVKLKATIDAKFYDGEIEVVNALIPGKSKQEVVLVAHLCHPKPSANDNASGCGVLLETARTLKFLIDSKKLCQPERSIRFLLLPEMSGSYAFLANNESTIPNMVAALNLDMVGQKQSLCHSPLIAEMPPHAIGHFAGDLLKEALNTVAAEVSNLAGTAKYALFMHTVTPFSGGSDHYIFSDPTIGVGTPMLIQWPDKYYHTSQDTIDKVDPKMLKRVGTIAALYSYYCATAKESDILWLAEAMYQNYVSAIATYLKQQFSKASLLAENSDWQKVMDLKDYSIKHLKYLQDIKIEQFKSLAKFNENLYDIIHEYSNKTTALTSFKIKESTNLFEGLFTKNKIAINSFHTTTCENNLTEEAKTIIAKRLSRGPISLRGKLTNLSAATLGEYRRLKKLYAKDFSKLTYLMYWMDGKRNLAEIITKIKHETNQFNAEPAIFMVKMLVELGLVEV